MLKKIQGLLKGTLKYLRYQLLFQYKLGWLYDLLIQIKNSLFGARVRLEASSVCQLQCPACPTGTGANRGGVIGWGFLKFEGFKKIIDENPRVKRVELSNWGEIFLNPDLPEIIEYAYIKGVRLEALNGVNLNNVSDETLEFLVKYRFDCISVSLDGATHETYKIYRQKGNLYTVIRNIKRINHFKSEYQSSFPKLLWQFVVFGHNEHELPKARKMAKELGMSFRPKLNFEPTYSPVRDERYVKIESGLHVASRDEFLRKRKRAYLCPCTQLWDSPQINWDGKLLGCCVNRIGDFGNVFELGLNGALNTEVFRYAKRMVLGIEPPREDIPCISCEVYRTRMESSA